MAGTQPIVVAVTSDHHVGSTVGLCPDEGVRLDDGGTYRPSKAQLWIWENWNDYWAKVAALRKRHKAQLYCAYNGDLFDGAHHGTTQIVSAHPEVQAYLAGRVFGVPGGLRPERQFIIRGTEAHVGPSGSTEEAFARSIKAEKNPEQDRWSWWHLRLPVHGVRFDFQHHGRMGQRPWTKLNVVSNLAAQIFYEHAARNIPHPHLAFRSHLHQYADTHDAHPVRVIQTPAWQLKTAYVHKVAADNLADVGGIIAVVLPDGSHEVTKCLYSPELPKQWQPA